MRRVALVLALMLIAGAASCRGKAPDPARPSELVAGPSALASVSSAPVPHESARNPAAFVPYATPKLAPMPVAELEVKAGEAWPKRSLVASKRLGRGGVVLPGVLAPDRVVVATPDHKGLFLDARTGQTLAKLPAEPDRISPRAGAATLVGDPPRLLRLADAQVVTPTIDAGGRKLARTWLATSADRSAVLALAESDAGEKLAAIAPPDLVTFHLGPAPLDPASSMSVVLNAFGGFALVASTPQGFRASGTPFPFAHEPGCVRARVADDGVLTCLEHLPYTGDMRGVTWMDGGYFATGDGVSHVSWGRRTIDFAHVLGGMQCTTRATHDSPPRVVAACHGAPKGALWTPDALLTFGGFADPNDVGGLVGASSGPVLPILEPHQGARVPDQDRASELVDLARGRLWTVPSLRPLAIAAFSGVGANALAEQRKGEVWLLDFEKGTRELVAKIGDCAGVLGELSEDRDAPAHRLVLACMTPAPEGMVAHTLVWAEIVDLDARVRWRTTLLPELLFDDGLVVLSSRVALAAESKAAPGDLYSVDLK